MEEAKLKQAERDECKKRWLLCTRRSPQRWRGTV